MSHITVQCRLVASESTRHHLWKLMADLNTPLINELLAQMAQHPKFETWRKKGSLPAGIVKQLCQPLKADPRFTNQPARFYTSAIAVVEYIYKSWFKLQQRLAQKLSRKISWLGMLKSDEELTAESNTSVEVILTNAAELLNSLSSEEGSIYTKLWKVYNDADDLLTRCVVCYLFKNSNEVPEKSEENLEEFAKRRRKTEIQIERIKRQLESRLPKGRDLTGESWLETLAIASTTAPTDESEAKSWQNKLLTEPKLIPFPVGYETSEDLTWRKNDKGRLSVKFNGLGKHTFQIYCDQRQLKWFERFYEDQKIRKGSKNEYSSSLFTLRSGRIAWQGGTNTNKDDPWKIHQLILYCTVDTRFWTAEGTEQVCKEKAEGIAKTLTKMEEKGELNDNQQAFIRHEQSTLARLNNPFPRPSQPPYQGQPHILIGVALERHKPTTIAVFDGKKDKVITYRSFKQLLGDNYELLNKRHKRKQKESHQRHKAQRDGSSNQFGDSQLGEHIDRLIAKAIVTFAQTSDAGSIVLPKLGDIRESFESKIQAQAEQKFPELIENRKKYLKRYRIQVHQWSYGRLINDIKAQASKLGMVVEEGQQPIRASPQEKAKEVAISAYRNRRKS
ncbi:type V CRISPR-associated protein Cas12k [Coleofasciculus sp. FACHB-T130]|uniref:type V CRISPR-associated protein Cas12k n=1 Tax=Cyanophyceae TaxID=3028117 RepID=UPI0016894BF6|nr:type V CRISPR-associated protein Cas12k [Coleofasciculus sp. FACHB-T130]MBD1881266.1 hypothetical protein [Coleofasciculus sp. FACHB-T130]